MTPLNSAKIFFREDEKRTGFGRIIVSMDGLVLTLPMNPRISTRLAHVSRYHTTSQTL